MPAVGAVENSETSGWLVSKVDIIEDQSYIVRVAWVIVLLEEVDAWYRELCD